MLKVLISVGTTKFDELIELVDNVSTKYEYEFMAQISNGKYLPKNIKYFEFSNNIKELYEWADVIICHAGAGTIYTLLEMKKKVIVIPNKVRVDKHQSDIANAMLSKGFIKSVNTLNEENLKLCLDEINSLSFNEYKKDDFFIEEDLISYILS